MDIQPRLTHAKAKMIYRLIRKHGTVSKAQLGEWCDLTNSTLTRTLEELSQSQIIVETGLGESTGGRRPILYQVNPGYAYVMGLDISRNECRLVLCDMQLHVLSYETWATVDTPTPLELFEKVEAQAKNWQSFYRIGEKQWLGLGIGAVGPLDRKNGKLLEPLYFPSTEWNDVAISRQLSELLQLPVFLDNGANNALLAEYWLSPAQTFDHLLYLHTGVGLRSAMMTNGQIVYGAVDMEGAAGQMVIQANGAMPREREGNFGAWESYATLYALEQQAHDFYKQGRHSRCFEGINHIQEITFPRMVQAHRDNDPLMQELMEQSAVMFGIGLANMLNILHPQQVILGGPLLTSVPAYYTTAVETAKNKTYHFPQYQVVFSPSAFGDEAIAIGSASLVIQQLLHG